MNQHLRIALDPFVKLFVCRRRIIDINLMRYYEAWLGLARHNHVSEIPVVGFDVALPSSKMQALDSSAADKSHGG